MVSAWGYHGFRLNETRVWPLHNHGFSFTLWSQDCPAWWPSSQALEQLKEQQQAAHGTGVAQAFVVYSFTQHLQLQISAMKNYLHVYA